MTGRLRRRIDGVLTALGAAKRGFFIPYRGAAALPAAGALPPYATLGSLLQASEPAILAHLAVIEQCAEALERLGGEPPAPRWTQDWFPRLDGAAAYAMVARRRPRRIVEIGSGHSTRFLARAVADTGCAARITAIDPAPRANLAGLDVAQLRCTVQGAGAPPFDALEANDFVVVDSSHVLMPGSDVDHLLNRVLPRLPAGVHLHFHDIFLPDDYPPEWGWRGYNEQLAVAVLVASGAYAVQFASAYVVARHPEWLARGVLARLPLVPGARESSLWLTKRV
jgi:predicted O-methyltransferase YrrM